jgi:hypothetical protein
MMEREEKWCFGVDIINILEGMAHVDVMYNIIILLSTKRSLKR